MVAATPLKNSQWEPSYRIVEATRLLETTKPPSRLSHVIYQKLMSPKQWVFSNSISIGVHISAAFTRRVAFGTSTQHSQTKTHFRACVSLIILAYAKLYQIIIAYTFHLAHVTQNRVFNRAAPGGIRGLSSLVASRSSVWPGSSLDSAWGALKIAKVAYKWLRSMVYGRYNTGWWFQPLWKIWKSVGIIIPNIWKYKKCSKPPTSRTR